MSQLLYTLLGKIHSGIFFLGGGKGHACWPHPMPSNTLVLRVHRPWFDAIAHGHKTVEYRRDTPYWRTRIHGRKYERLQFVNGYGARMPALEVAYHGYDMHTGADGHAYFRLRLGRVLGVSRYEVRGGGASDLPRTPMDLNRCLDPNRPQDCMRFSRVAGAWVPRHAPAPTLQLEVEAEIQRGGGAPAPCRPTTPVGTVRVPTPRVSPVCDRVRRRGRGTPPCGGTLVGSVDVQPRASHGQRG